MAESKESKQGAHSSLEGFLVVSKGAQGKQLEAIIRNVLGKPDIFIFGELLELQNYQALQGTESQPHLDLLKIFAYGTWKDYLAKKAMLNLPDLTAAQTYKLKQLSLVSLASQNKVLKYSTIKSALDLSDTRELEDLIIESTYANLLEGQLDQRSEQLDVLSVMGRDIGVSDVRSMLDDFDSWLKTADAMIHTLQSKSKDAKQANVEKKRVEAQRENEKDKLVTKMIEQAKDEALRQAQKKSQGGGGGGGNMAGGAVPVGIDEGFLPAGHKGGRR